MDNVRTATTPLADALLSALGHMAANDDQPPAGTKKLPKKKAQKKVQAATASTKKDGPVRNVLWDGGDLLVQVSIPTMPIRQKNVHAPAPYHECVAGVKGGFVKFFFYDLPIGACPGMKVVAKMKIMERLNRDGTKLAYVDFHVVEGGDATHTLHVHSMRAQFRTREETERAELVSGTDGVIEIRQRANKTP